MRGLVRLLDQRARVERWRARAGLVLRFAWLGWRVGAARERLNERRSALARALGR